MRRVIALACSVGCGAPGDSGESVTAASSPTSTAAGTSSDTSGSPSATSVAEATSDVASTGGATQASTGAGSSVGESTEGGSEGGGTLAGCQHAWDFSRCPQSWEVGKADAAALSAPSWACGDPSGAPAQGGAHTGVWATNLAGDYSEDESSALTSPSFSLADCAGATIYLTFAHLYQFGSGDGGTVQVSTDGGNGWTTIEPSWHGYCAGTLDVPWSPPGGEPGFCNGDDETWLHSLASLDDLGGEPDVRVRFVMGSDGIIEQVGWYVDSVTIEAY